MQPKIPESNQSLAILIFVLILLLGASALPDTRAAASANNGNAGDVCAGLVVASVSLQNSAGDVVHCIQAPTRVATATSTWTLSASLDSPALSGTNPSLTLTASGLNGCSAGTATTFGTAANAASDPETSNIWVITMTAPQCRGYVEGKVTVAGVTLYDGAIAFNVLSDDQAHIVTNTGTLTIHQDALSGSLNVHQDALTGAVTVHQDALSGTVNVVNTGALTNTLTGSVNMDTLDRECAASAHGAVCTQPPLVGNLSVSGVAFNLTLDTGCSSAKLAADPYACTTRIENQPNGNATALTIAPTTGDWGWAYPLALLLGWVLYAYTVSRVPSTTTRILTAVAGMAWLALPLAQDTWAALLVLQLLLLVWVFYAWSTDRRNTP